MKPILFSFHLPLVGEISFPAYFTLLFVGFGLAMLLSVREAKRQGLDYQRVIDLNIYAVLFGLLGSRLLHVLADGYFWDYVHICTNPEIVKAIGANVPTTCVNDAQCAPHYLCNIAAGHCHPPRDCLLALKFWSGGLTYYGGFIAAFLFSLYYMRRHQLPAWKIADLAGFGIPLGLVWGRLGCYFNGCCFGRVTDGPLGVVFPRGGAAWRHQIDVQLVERSALTPLPVHPAQLYLAALNLVMFIVCYFVIRPRKKFDGQIFWWFILQYTVFRSLVEIVRDDDRGVLFGWLSTSQLISIPFFFLAIYMLRRLGAKKIS